MQRSTQKNGLVNLLALLVVGAAALAVARMTHSLAGQVSAAFIGIGALVAAVSWFQMRLEEIERLEKLELEELGRSKGGSSLFEAKEVEMFPAQRSRQQFERFFVPIFTVLLFLAEAAGAWLLWRWMDKGVTLIEVQLATFALALFGLFALILFLLGKFSATIARLENHRLLRPGASWLLLGAYLCFVTALGIVGVEADFPKADYYVALVLCGVLGLIAAETLVALVLEIYRPRVKGKVERPLYESRLVGMLAHPEGLFTTAAQALDYQFGFKISETWAYQMLAEKLPVFVLGLVGVTILSSCLVFLEPGEQALVERFGRAATGRTVLGPGPHLKLPWPIDRVYRFDTGRVQSFNVGFVPDPAREQDTTILWTVSHYKEEFNLLVASGDQPTSVETNPAAGERAVPVNLLVAGIPVQYRITNVLAWAYGHASPEALLQQAATREIVRFFAGVDLLNIMSVDRGRAARELRDRIQARSDELRLGVEVFFVGLQDIHPPVTVAGAFEDVNGAAQTVEAKILRAEGQTNKTVLLAQADALERVRTAEGEATNRVAAAAAQAARFTNQIAAYLAAPEVYPPRLLLQTLARASAGTRKYLVSSTNTHEVIQLNLEDTMREDLLRNLTVKPANTNLNR
jgi:membrane protease subunit HflK